LAVEPLVSSVVLERMMEIASLWSLEHTQIPALLPLFGLVEGLPLSSF
jgi:hypothetical protein